MVASQRVIVAHCAASLRSIFVIVEDIVCQVGQLSKVFLDVQDVRVEVEVFISVRVCFEQILEPVDCDLVLLSLVAAVGHLVAQVDRVGEVAQERCVQRDRDLLLLDVQIEAGKVEVEHPVIAQLVEHVPVRLRDQ